MRTVAKQVMAVAVCLALAVSALAGCAAIEGTIKERPKTSAGAAAGAWRGSHWRTGLS
jgi:uncharacterized protein YceK